ncbi:hypothetical protein PM082_007769 [Marasmius tenuissimus]|nr:hypothetical protein PM082_007769 [Marasmius tenuissimus]
MMGVTYRLVDYPSVRLIQKKDVRRGFFANRTALPLEMILPWVIRTTQLGIYKPSQERISELEPSILQVSVHLHLRSSIPSPTGTKMYFTKFIATSSLAALPLVYGNPSNNIVRSVSELSARQDLPNLPSIPAGCQKSCTSSISPEPLYYHHQGHHLSTPDGQLSVDRSELTITIPVVASFKD